MLDTTQVRFFARQGIFLGTIVQDQDIWTARKNNGLYLSTFSLVNTLVINVGTCYINRFYQITHPKRPQKAQKSMNLPCRLAEAFERAARFTASHKTVNNTTQKHPKQPTATNLTNHLHYGNCGFSVGNSTSTLSLHNTHIIGCRNLRQHIQPSVPDDRFFSRLCP